MRRCLFCGGTANSKEHVWPAWLLALLSDGERSHVFHVSTVNPDRNWEGAPAALTVRGVCKVCNNGWMSELETLTQPIVTPLILGESATLDIEEQITIATWGIKASMLWEPASGVNPGFYTEADRRWVYEEAMPPFRTSIWIAKYAGGIDKGLLGFSTNRSYARRSGAPIHGRLTTMLFGHLVIQTMSLHIDDPGPMMLRAQMSPGPWEDEGVADVRVWPEASDGVRWPPPVMLTDDSPTAVQDYGRRW